MVECGAPQPAQPFSVRWLCTNVHFPASKKRPYTWEARQGVLDNLVALTDGGTTPMLVGGDLNFGLGGLRSGLQQAGLPAQETFIAKSRENKFRHGDLAVALGGLVAIQENSEMGASFGGVSDNHDVVLVPLARVGSGVPSQMVSSASAGQPGLQLVPPPPPPAEQLSEQPPTPPRQPPAGAGKPPRQPPAGAGTAGAAKRPSLPAAPGEEPARRRVSLTPSLSPSPPTPSSPPSPPSHDSAEPEAPAAAASSAPAAGKGMAEVKAEVKEKAPRQLRASSAPAAGKHELN